MKTFYRLLGVALIAITTTNFVWFALTYWAYLSTGSVISTSMMAGVYLVATALSANWFGSIVDRYKKKHVMLGSSLATLLLFSSGLLLFYLSTDADFAVVTSPRFWFLVLILLFGVIAGSMYSIVIPTLVAFLVPEDRRDRANGLFGTVMGVSFAITSVASGLALAFGGISLVLSTAIIFTLLSSLILWLIPVPEGTTSNPAGNNPKKMDIKGTIEAIRAIPGLFALIFFATFNNFLGGDPLRNLFRINIILWIVCIFFTIQPSIVLLAAGVFIYMFFIPFVEAIEQTIFQKVVPKERLGRVFGFAYSIELAASPLTAFFIGPIAQFVFIPFMTTGRGVELIGSWFGVGAGRGIALVFIFTGCIGLIVTLIVMRSRPYRLLAARYNEPTSFEDEESL